MNLLFVLGNGFDRNLKIKSGFNDFYDYYCNCPSAIEAIADLKENIKKFGENWSDLEIGLGKYTTKLKNKDDFIEILADVHEHLYKYLETETKNVIFEKVATTKLDEEFFSFEKHLMPRDRKLYETHKKNNSSFNADIITFNYTDSVERIVQGRLKQAIGSHKVTNVTFAHYIRSITHVHGTLSESMLVGVNDLSQIQNENFKTEEMNNYIVKPTMNFNAGTLREEFCERRIEEADVICVFGMSLGETDKYWWEKILYKLKNSNALLIIVGVNSKINPRTIQWSVQIINEIKDKMLSYGTDLNDKDKEKIKKQIIVAMNTNMFKFETSRTDVSVLKVIRN